jgi:1,4-dihydroxy-2-naphthoate polyprenyltransferase
MYSRLIILGGCLINKYLELMLHRNTITLLRIPFSYFLMPVFFFSLSQVSLIDYKKTFLVFIILHFIMYPASNGYNSYMDRDEESIGMLENPPKPTKQLFWLTAALDCVATGLSFLVNIPFAICITANILASRAYSYRGIRLKKYPVAGFLTVVIFQGAVTYFMVYKGSAMNNHTIPWTGMLISSFLFGGFYPLTQIYQHDQDFRDGVQTISYKLGINGTFIFSGIMYALSEVVMFFYFLSMNSLSLFWLLQLFFIPVVGYFFYWWKKVRENRANASFYYAMRMNLVAATSTNMGFILLYLVNHFF